MFDDCIARFGERAAFHSMGKTITFAELERASRSFGAFLQGRGFKKGMRVAIMMPNCLQYPVTIVITSYSIHYTKLYDLRGGVLFLHRPAVVLRCRLDSYNFV